MANFFVFRWLRGGFGGVPSYLSFKGTKPVAKVDNFDAAGISVGEL